VPLTFMNLRIPTLDELPKRCKKVLLRIDINSPIDDRGRILDRTRFNAHKETILELLDSNKALVIMAHQGRPGQKDFTSLKGHAKVLSEIIDRKVTFIEDVFGPEARRTIANMKEGEVIMLDNTRLSSEDFVEAPPEIHANSIFVSRLSKVVDCYVNDAFAASHRSQASLVGFPLRMPSASGRLLEKELKAISKILERPEKPKTFVLGGAKIKDMIEVIDYSVRHNVADYILTTGLLALLFLKAKGMDVGESEEILRRKGGSITLIQRARKLLEMSKGRILVPNDFVCEKEDKVKVLSSDKIEGVPKDIGPETIDVYSKILKNSAFVVMKGPAGVIEDPRFRIGTKGIVEATLSGKAFTVFGGGHFNVILSELSEELRRRVGHISTGGGALVYVLTGRELPAVKALDRSYKLFYSGKS